VEDRRRRQSKRGLRARRCAVGRLASVARKVPTSPAIPIHQPGPSLRTPHECRAGCQGYRRGCAALCCSRLRFWRASFLRFLSFRQRRFGSEPRPTGQTVAACSPGKPTSRDGGSPNHKRVGCATSVPRLSAGRGLPPSLFMGGQGGAVGDPGGSCSRRPARPVRGSCEGRPYSGRCLSGVWAHESKWSHAITERASGRSTSQLFGVIRVGHRHAVLPANRDDLAK
jgi:hypothetical protein